MLESYKIYKQRSEDENGILIDDSFPISEAARKNSDVFCFAKNSRPRIGQGCTFRSGTDATGIKQKREGLQR